jgi:hypothetical protein
MRYVSWNRLRRDGESDEIIGFLGQAFQLKPAEDELSGTWVEFFQGDAADQRHAAVRATRNAQKVGAKSAFAVGLVGRIREICSTHGATVRILHEPEDNNPAHAVIRRLPRDNADLLDNLASDAFDEMILNRDVP